MGARSAPAPPGPSASDPRAIPEFPLVYSAE